jgi:hypothetical protein
VGKCDAADLVRLFGSQLRAAQPDYRALSVRPNNGSQASDQQTAGALQVDETDPAALRGPGAVAPPGVTLLNACPAKPEWDSNGHRVKGQVPSAFPRPRGQSRRATHWSS